jgi:hypothetical protein
MGNHSASRQKERPESGAVIDRLARFTGGELTDPAAFGGGADRARVGMRAQTVAYGYLAVVDEYEHPYTGAVCSTLTVSLPCPVSPMSIDHSSVLGRPGVPYPGAYGLRSADPEFDGQYSVTAADPATAITLITSKLRDVLIRRPIQRLAFDRARLLLRTFDGVQASVETIDWLDALACAVLAATPAFVMRAAGATLPPIPRTFPRGLYGLDEPEDMGPRARAVAAFMSRFAFADRRRAYGR